MRREGSKSHARLVPGIHVAATAERLDGRQPGHDGESFDTKSKLTENNAMKAYVYGANGAEITDVAKPAPKGAQVLVRVRACGLNRADLGMTKGQAHGSAGGVGTVLGMEWAGEVAEARPRRQGRQGRRQDDGLGRCRFRRIHAGRSRPAVSHRRHRNMNFEEAATLPVALTTMHNAVVTNGALQAGPDPC